VTKSVVDALAPGLIVSDEEPKDAVQPLGRAALRLKVEALQAELSLLVTDAV
jgi:hypothetical protein